MKAGSDHELSAEDLEWRLPPEFRDVAYEQVESVRGTIGQDRAGAALDLGLALRAPGYNVFVAGPHGTGRTSTVRRLLDGMKSRRCPELRDRAYVYNFSDPSCPRLLTFPAGKAREFGRDMARFVEHLREIVPSILEEDVFRKEREAIHGEAVRIEQSMIGDLEAKLKEKGFALIQIRAGDVVMPDILPLVDDTPVDWEKASEQVAEGKLDRAAYERLRQDADPMRRHMQSVFKKLRALASEVGQKTRDLERRAVEHLAGTLVGEIRDKYRDEKVQEYLAGVVAEVLEDIDLFKRAPAKEGGLDLSALIGRGRDAEDVLVKYEVNVLLDNSNRSGCPVEFEDAPSHGNLIGTIEVEGAAKGAPRTDFTHIKAGSVLKADGGFLVLQALDLLLAPGAWPALKRVLKTGRLEIRTPEFLGLFGPIAMKPEPIEVDVKVILIGETGLYDLLYRWEEDFKTVFKVLAQFDHEMPLARETLGHFLGVVHKIGEDEKLLPLAPDAAHALTREAVRRAGRRDRISTKFSDVADLVRETCYWAQQEGASRAGARHVERAIREFEQRNGLLEEKIQEAIDRGLLHVDLTGAVVGQVNGLSVFDLGSYSFGKPSRITAAVSIGRAGIINIEREAGLSGRIHDKGVLVLSGFLRNRFAQNFPLSLSASLAFEQSYHGVEGDSASSTEAYALLSALAQVPVRQSIGVTGSVDQYGRIQAIGGINEKIEGFFLSCTSRGLTGEQGVLFPRANQRDLMVRDEVVEAVREGRFHLWAVETVDDGIQILTGVPAGARRADGTYPEGSINRRVEARLQTFAQVMAEFEARRS